MCLSVPGKIVSIAGDEAIIDYGVEKREGRLLAKEFSVGDYVIIQGGFVVEKIDAAEAVAALKLYQEALENSRR